MPDSPNFIKAVNGFIKDHNIHYPGENVEEIVAVTSLNQPVIVGNNEHGELLISDFIKETVYNCFVHLTEIPVLFDYVKGNDYTPIPKKQVVRDRNGNLLSSDAADFDMAPMMKICETDQEVITQFTDFGLDGASKAKYFYAAKEISLQMQTSAYSEILGPIAMVNTSPPVSPDIVKVISVLENRTLNIDPSIEFNINSYPSVQDVRKINLYRTTDRSASLSVRTMDLVKVVDLESENMLDLNIWTFKDSFSDLAFVPYGDLLYYRITVSRRIKYNNSEEQLIIDYAPSEASKLIVNNIANNYLPDSPIPSYTSEPFDGESLNSVVLQWEQTVYNGKYHIYKISPQGNWIKIDEIATNDAIINLQVDNLVMVNVDDNYINHHFKVLAENFSGMISTKENILTIYINAEGIGAMIIEDTFIVAE